jgi:4-amino-4-deoxy-L-arabinose transferase-like glycosyltransferase
MNELLRHQVGVCRDHLRFANAEGRALERRLFFVWLIVLLGSWATVTTFRRRRPERSAFAGGSETINSGAIAAPVEEHYWPEREQAERRRWLQGVFQARATYLLALTVVFAGASLIRFWRLGDAPGWEWDEPNYTDIAGNLLHQGELAIKADVIRDHSTYLFHPPFYFLLLAGWFRLVGSGIYEARLLLAGVSLLVLFLSYQHLRPRLGRFALVPLTAIAFDGWLVFSGRVAWFDHLALLIGLVGLILYERAIRLGSSRAYCAAGVALGAATAFKQTAAYLLLAVLIHWLLTRGPRRAHLFLFTAAASVVGLYVGAMLAIFGRTYWDASVVQLRRATGTWNSGGGTISDASGAIGPLLHQYRLFYATIVIGAFGLVLLAYRLITMVARRSTAPVDQYGIVFSWLVAGLIFFGALQIRFPQYFMMVLIPLYGFLALEAHRWLQRGGRERVLLVAAVMVALFGADGLTFDQRLATRSDNALKAVAAFANANIPSSDLVITEQPIGVLIRQPYCETWAIERCAPRARWLIYYRTDIFEPQKAYKVRLLADHAVAVARFTGFKERIIVYRLAASYRLATAAAVARSSSAYDDS